MADVDRPARRRGFERGQRAGDLSLLQRDRLRVAQRLRAREVLVTDEQRRVAQAVAERLQPQGRKAPRGLGGKELSAAGEMVEIFGDHPAVVERRAVLQRQRRDFAERILRADAVVRVGEVDAGDRDAVREPEHGGGDADLARVG